MSAPLLIRLTRLSNDCHRFEGVRSDGSSEARDLDTRSFLLHDLVHYAVETEAKLTSSFYGRLAAGEAYEALTKQDGPMSGEALATERVVVLFQSASRRHDWAALDPAAFVAAIAGSFRNSGDTAPDWLDSDFVVRARERLRQLQGRWRATPFGETMTLEFALDAPRAPIASSRRRGR